MALLLFTVSAMICLLASILFLLHPQSSHSLPNSLQVVLPSFLQTQHAGWWSKKPNHQLKSDSGVDADEWDLLYHLGGNGPWVEKVDGVVEGGIQVPAGCKVDMVHMVCSHELGVKMKKKSAKIRASCHDMGNDSRPRRPATVCILQLHTISLRFVELTFGPRRNDNVTGPHQSYRDGVKRCFRILEQLGIFYGWSPYLPLAFA